MGWFAKQKLADHPKFYHKSHFQWQFRIHFCFLSSPCHNSIKNSKVCKLQFYEWNVFLFYIFYILQHMLFTNKPIKLFYMCNLSFFLNKKSLYFIVIKKNYTQFTTWRNWNYFLRFISSICTFETQKYLQKSTNIFLKVRNI